MEKAQVPSTPIGIPLHILSYGRSGKIFQNNTEIAVKLIPGPHNQQNNEQNFVNPVNVGMKVTWPSNTSTPATVKSFFIGESNPDSTIKNVIYITLDKHVDPDTTIFYLSSVAGFQIMAPASVITQGHRIFSNISPATQQALEFKLGQRALAHWQSNK
jgi:hypothetical protein